MDGSCRFGVNKCWYAHKCSHQINQTGNLNQDPEVINRLFTIMENLQKGLRILKINFDKHGIQQ